MTHLLIFVCECLWRDGRDEFSLEEDLWISTCRERENFTMIARNFSAGYAACERASGTCTSSLKTSMRGTDNRKVECKMDVSAGSVFRMMAGRVWFLTGGGGGCCRCVGKRVRP